MNSHHHGNQPIIEFDRVMDNESFLLSHLTNQGDAAVYRNGLITSLLAMNIIHLKKVTDTKWD